MIQLKGLSQLPWDLGNTSVGPFCSARQEVHLLPSLGPPHGIKSAHLTYPLGPGDTYLHFTEL